MFRITFATAALLSVAAPSFSQTAGQPAPAPSVIATQAEASVKRAADRAWVAISAETRAPKPADAQRLAATAMTNVQTALKAHGIPVDAIRTTGYSVQADMEYSGGSARVKGYIAHNQIEVRVDALDGIGDVLDAAGSSGATSIAGLRFDLKNREAVEAEALRTAVQNAMKRAEIMASGAGRTLGAIVRLEEIGSMQPQPMFEARTLTAMAGAPAQTPIVSGEIEVTARVALTVAIR